MAVIDAEDIFDFVRCVVPRMKRINGIKCGVVQWSAGGTEIEWPVSNDKSTVMASLDLETLQAAGDGETIVRQIFQEMDLVIRRLSQKEPVVS